MKKKQFIFIMGIMLILSFGLGFMGGTAISVQEALTNDSGEVEVTKVLDLYAHTRSEEVSFDQFWTVWNMIKDNYVDKPVNEVDLFYGAIAGMVEGLDDPYSVYFPPVEAKEFADNLSGEFDGIGAEIGIRDDILTVIAPLPDSPAEKAGLKAGDKIYAIDGEDTSGITIEKAVTQIRGKKGTDVVLTVSHNGFESLEEVTVTRDVIVIPTIVLEDDGDGIYYLRVSHFNEDTWGEFDDTIDELVAQKPTGIILDMRSNPGGLLDSSIRVASEWMTEGVVVQEQQQDGQINQYIADGKHRLKDIPTVVLVDQGTASGAEIVAGALQDYDLAQLVGDTTFGKGSVQHFEILPDGSALKLTVAKWLTPDGRQINEVGIKPDVQLEEMFVEDETAENGFMDLGREKAKELLVK